MFVVGGHFGECPPHPSVQPPCMLSVTPASVNLGMSAILWPAGGRYLGDVWILNLDKLEWIPTVYSGGKQAPGPPPSSGPDNPPPPQPSLPPCAGHALVPWGSSLLSVGGLTKVR